MLQQVLVAMTTRHRCPRNGVIAREKDAEYIALQNRDPVDGVEGEKVVPHPEGGDYRLSDATVTIVTGARINVYGAPNLEVDDLRATAAGRVYVPTGDEAIGGSALRWVDDEDGAFLMVLRLPPVRLVAQETNSTCTQHSGN